MNKTIVITASGLLLAGVAFFAAYKNGNLARNTQMSHRLHRLPLSKKCMAM